mgnify:CR=1 FL=1
MHITHLIDGRPRESAERFETVDMMACIRSEQAWREGRYHLAVGRLDRYRLCHPVIGGGQRDRSAAQQRQDEPRLAGRENPGSDRGDRGRAEAGTCPGRAGLRRHRGKPGGSGGFDAVLIADSARFAVQAAARRSRCVRHAVSGNSPMDLGIS